MRRFLDLFLRLAVSAALIGLILYFVPLAAVSESLRNAALLPMFASYLLIPVMGYIDANRTKMMTDLQGMTLSLNAIVRIGFITSFYSLFLPGLLAGGLIRWHRLSRQDKKPAQALAIVIFSRMLSMIVTVAVGLLCWLIEGRSHASSVFGLALIGLLTALLIAHWLMFSGVRARAVANWVDRRKAVPQVIRSKVGKVLHSVGKFDELPRSRLLSTAGLLVVHELIGIGSFYLIALSADLGLSFIAIGWVRAYVVLIAMLPVSILGMGVREGSLILMLGTYGIAPAVAVAYSLLLLSRTVAIGLLGGVLEAFNVLRTKNKVVPGEAP